MCWCTLRPLSCHLGLTSLPRLWRTQVKRPYRIGGHPMVIWMWCHSPMDDRDGGPLRADVSLFRFQPLVYIVCVLSSTWLYLVRMSRVWEFLYHLVYRLSGLTLVVGSAPASSYLVKKF